MTDDPTRPDLATLVKARIDKWRVEVDFMTSNPERRSAFIDARRELEDDLESAAAPVCTSGDHG